MITTVDEAKRVRALARHLGVSYKDVNIEDDNTFKANGNEYLVLDDDEANARAREYIIDSLWAFNASFLANYTDLPEEVFTLLSEKCENGNEAIAKLIEKTGSLDDFVYEAISADGRGHFMSSYDGCEHEVGNYFIYRVN